MDGIFWNFFADMGKEVFIFLSEQIGDFLIGHMDKPDLKIKICQGKQISFWNCRTSEVRYLPRIQPVWVLFQIFIQVDQQHADQDHQQAG